MLRLTARSLLGKRVFAASVVLCLGLGVAASASLFAVLHAVLLRELPYYSPKQLVLIRGRLPHQGLERTAASAGEYRDYREQRETFAATAAVASRYLNLSGDGEPQRWLAARVSPSLLSALGVRVALGRDFMPDEEIAGHHRVALLSDGLWRSRFGADPDVVGRVLTLGGEPFEVVGVLPAGFSYLPGGLKHDLWVPLVLEQSNPARDFRNLQVVARLNEGLSVEAGQEVMATLARRFQQDYPQAYPPGDGWGIRLVPIEDEVLGGMRGALWLVSAAVVLVLFSVAFNLSTLAVVRIAGGEREIAVRLALGASRFTAVAGLVSEALLLGLIGAGLGLAAAAVIVRSPWLAGAAVPRIESVALDFPSLLVSALVLLAMVVGAQLLPIWWRTRRDLAARLGRSRDETASPGERRLASVAMAIEVAFALVVLVGAGLLVRSLQSVSALELGFAPRRLLTFQVFLPPTQYGPPHLRSAYAAELLSRLRAIAGAEGVTFANGLPLGELWNLLDTELEGTDVASDASLPLSDWRVIHPDYFSVLRIPLLAGRSFSALDSEQAAAVAIVDQGFAIRHFAGASPLGRRIRLLGRPDGREPWLTVVGVVGTVRALGLEAEPREQVYTPYEQGPTPALSFALRSEGEALTLAPAVRQAARAVDPDLAIDRLTTMESTLAQASSARRALTLLVTLFALTSLLLVAIGMYGVMTSAVERRRPEIGLRLALGARGGSIFGLVTAQALRLALIGLGPGLLLALPAARASTSLLYGVPALDAATYLAVGVLLLVVTFAAAGLPALRAARSSPAAAMRGDSP